MIALLLGYGAKLLARPALLVGLASLIAMGWLQFSHSREVKKLKAEISTTHKALSETRVALAEHQAALSDVSANRDMWLARVREQNNAIELLHIKAKANQAAAVSAAVRKLQAVRESADELRAPTSKVPPGDVAMNEWLKERFAR